MCRTNRAGKGIITVVTTQSSNVPVLSSPRPVGVSLVLLQADIAACLQFISRMYLLLAMVPLNVNSYHVVSFVNGEKKCPSTNNFLMRHPGVFKGVSASGSQAIPFTSRAATSWGLSRFLAGFGGDCAGICLFRSAGRPRKTPANMVAQFAITRTPSHFSPAVRTGPGSPSALKYIYMYNVQLTTTDAKSQ